MTRAPCFACGARPPRYRTVHARAGMLLCLHLLAAARVVKEPYESEAFARVANKTAIRPIARMHAGVYVVARRHATTPEAEEPICQLDKYSVGDRRRRNCSGQAPATRTS